MPYNTGQFGDGFEYNPRPDAASGLQGSMTGPSIMNAALQGNSGGGSGSNNPYEALYRHSLNAQNRGGNGVVSPGRPPGTGMQGPYYPGGGMTGIPQGQTSPPRDNGLGPVDAIAPGIGGGGFSETDPMRNLMPTGPVGGLFRESDPNRNRVRQPPMTGGPSTVAPQGGESLEQQAARWSQGLGFAVSPAQIDQWHQWVAADPAGRGQVDAADWFQSNGYANSAAGRSGADTMLGVNRGPGDAGAPQFGPGGGGAGGSAGGYDGAGLAPTPDENGNYGPRPPGGYAPAHGGTTGIPQGNTGGNPVAMGAPAPGGGSGFPQGVPHQGGGPQGYMDALRASLEGSQRFARQNALNDFRAGAGSVGAENSGSYYSGLGDLNNQLALGQADQINQLLYGASESQAGRDLQRYGIDTGAATSRDVASMGASAQMGAASAGASASMYGADRGYAADMARIAGSDRGNALQYDLGVLGINRDIYGIDSGANLDLMRILASLGPEAQYGNFFNPQQPQGTYGYRR